jgi:hypothetical protein
LISLDRENCSRHPIWSSAVIASLNCAAPPQSTLDHRLAIGMPVCYAGGQ